MHFVLQTPSLQHIALVKIVATLWNQRDIISHIEQKYKSLLDYVSLREEKGEWKAIEEKVEGKVSVLPLPKPCKKELFNFIKPIGMEIITWYQYHCGTEINENNCIAKLLLPAQLCWSMHGTVNYSKTAQLIVKDERLSKCIERRYEIACLNCLEEEAGRLIQFLPRMRIRKYITEAVRHHRMAPRILIEYFAGTLTRDARQLNRLFPAKVLRGESINQYLFRLVLSKGPRTTSEYFLRKVSEREKAQVLEDWSRRASNSVWSPTCGLMYWVSLMSSEQRRHMIRVRNSCVLVFSMNWPMQPLFMEVAKRGWQLMNTDNCGAVLGYVIDKINNGFRDYDYAQLFREYWRLTSAGHKQYFYNNVDQLADVIATKQKDFIESIFREAPLDQLKELIEKRYKRISPVLMDESVICDAALMECKEKAALISSNDRDNVEKRLRSEHVSRLIDMARASRIKSREKYLD